MKSILSISIFLACALQTTGMVWISNQSAYHATCWVTNTSGGSDAYYGIPPNAWESRSLNGWARSSSENVHCTLNGKSKDLSVPGNSYVVLYEDRIQVVPVAGDTLTWE